jgi:hypothetical protein
MKLLIAVVFFFLALWTIILISQLPQVDRFKVVVASGNPIWIDTKTGETKLLRYAEWSGKRNIILHEQVVAPIFE